MKIQGELVAENERAERLYEVSRRRAAAWRCARSACRPPRLSGLRSARPACPSDDLARVGGTTSRDS